MPGRRPSRRRARPVQDGQPRQHPQEPVKRRYRLTGLLHYPDPPPLSPLAIQSRVIEIAYRDASASTPSTVQKVGETVSLSPDTYLAKFQGFDDPLTRYVGAPQETDWVRIRAKSLGEFAAYRQILKAESALPSSYTDFEKLLGECTLDWELG